MTLSRVEVIFNFATWTAAVFYALYNFYLACEIFEHQEDTYNDFSPGWTFLNRRKDSADLEWQTTTYLLRKLIFWCLLHALLSHFLTTVKLDSLTRSKYIQYFHIVFSLLYLFVNLPLVLVAIIAVQPIIFGMCYTLHSALAMWICWLTCLSLNTLLKLVDFAEYVDYFDSHTEMDVYLTVTCIFWMNLKCFSYFMDKFTVALKSEQECDANDPMNVDHFEYFAYCLYLPSLFGGPFMSFTSYAKCVDGGMVSFLKFEKLGKNLFRIGFWVVFNEFALHFAYVNPMLYQIEHVKTFNAWTFYGYGYAMGQYFHIKYVILYGFSMSFAEFDGIPVYARPKCIGRIHVYSDMWKHFDRGFYVFLVRYLYIPLMGDKRTLHRQIFASTVCFLFVFVWHGVATFILIWTLINLFTITLEKWFTLFIRSQAGQGFMRALNLTDKWRQRLHAVIASPLLAISAMSNSYFFAGKEVGDAFFAQFFASQLSAKLTLFFLLYFCCQVSIEVKKWEDKKTKTEKSD